MMSETLYKSKVTSQQEYKKDGDLNHALGIDNFFHFWTNDARL